jgi:membrane-associated phospholipid phosphatase
MHSDSFTNIDTATGAYNLFVDALILSFHRRIDLWFFEFLINFGMICFILIVVPKLDRHPHQLIRALREFYPLLLFGVLYKQAGRLSNIIFENSFDNALQRIETRLFGFDPASRFARRFPQDWFAEYMHFAYASFYLIMPALGLLLYKDREHLRDYLFTLYSTIFVCYLLFVLIPANGPNVYAEKGFPGGFLFVPLMNSVIKLDVTKGGAIPSSHVAGAAVVLYYAWRYVPKTTVVFVPVCISLMLATVYCGYHYAIDVLAGLLTAAIMIGLSRQNPRRANASTQRSHRFAGIAQLFSATQIAPRRRLYDHAAFLARRLWGKLAGE